jgi:succinate dehydrogenase / fumarate reductase, membrane anchor subunit
MSSGARPRPDSGLELYAWLFMRVSGVVLVFLALGHLTIMHLINNIEVVNYGFVATRYMTPFWRTYDLVMLWLAMIHGTNGMRTLVDDYISSRGMRLVSLSSLYIVSFIILSLGSLVIFTFQPVTTP